MKIIHVVGARPNFMKIAPILEAIERHNEQKVNPKFESLFSPYGPTLRSSNVAILF
jgi:hypothetical protein